MTIMTNPPDIYELNIRFRKKLSYPIFRQVFKLIYEDILVTEKCNFQAKYISESLGLPHGQLFRILEDMCILKMLCKKKSHFSNNIYFVINVDFWQSNYYKAFKASEEQNK